MQFLDKQTMSIHELKIYLDLSLDSKSKVLDKYAKKFYFCYVFVDSEDGQCYLFDEYGNEKDVLAIHEITEDMIPKDIQKIVIPDGVANIGDFAFLDCNRLMNVTIPDSVTCIGFDAFYGCSDLTSVMIPNSVTSIGYNVFCGCRRLKSLVFKNKTIDQAKAMKSYPFGIKDESIIKAEFS